MSSVTLADLLREQEEEQTALATTGAQNRRKRKTSDSRRKTDREGGAEAGAERGKKKLKKAHKNAPAELKSNRPVSRYSGLVQWYRLACTALTAIIFADSERLCPAKPTPAATRGK